MNTLPFHTTRGPTVAPRAGHPLRQRLVVKAVAAPELSPKEAGTAGAKNQLDALKQMSKIVADSGVSSFHSFVQPCRDVKTFGRDC